YYWIVSGVASTGETVWSKTQSFTIMNEMSENLLGVELKAIVYPNPVNNDQVSVSFDTPHTGMVTISLFDLGGRFLYKEEVDHKAKVVSTVTIPITGLTKGIYPVVIQSGTSIITKKLVIMNTP
ncbi:MAG: T9SS type A sorting domain-containing protein, partial [Bacteroidales bacterium]|nr:T9SS type A sorting domain-containing protein [Bacteroidales bacterium]